MVKFLTKGLDESGKKEGILKRLKSIEDQSKITEEKKDNRLDIKSVGYAVDERLSQEVKNILDKLNNQEKLINYKKLDFKRDAKLGFYFSDYRSPKELFKAISYRNLSIEEGERLQDKFSTTFNELGEYDPRNPKYKESKIKLLPNAKNFDDGRKMIPSAFKDKIFPIFPDTSPPSEDFDEDFDKDREYSPDSDEDYIPKMDRSQDKTFDFSNNDLDDLLINIENELIMM